MDYQMYMYLPMTGDKCLPKTVHPTTPPPPVWYPVSSVSPTHVLVLHALGHVCGLEVLSLLEIPYPSSGSYSYPHLAQTGTTSSGHLWGFRKAPKTPLYSHTSHTGLALPDCSVTHMRAWWPRTMKAKPGWDLPAVHEVLSYKKHSMVIYWAKLSWKTNRNLKKNRLL